MKLFAVLLSMCFVLTLFVGICEARPRWGVQLFVSVDLQHRDIAKSGKAPEEVLVEKSKAHYYYLKVIEKNVKQEEDIRTIRVAIPRSGNKQMYIDFLKGLGFVKGVKETTKK